MEGSLSQDRQCAFIKGNIIARSVIVNNQLCSININAEHLKVGDIFTDLLEVSIVFLMEIKTNSLSVTLAHKYQKFGRISA